MIRDAQSKTVYGTEDLPCPQDDDDERVVFLPSSSTATSALSKHTAGLLLSFFFAIAAFSALTRTHSYGEGSGTISPALLESTISNSAPVVREQKFNQSGVPGGHPRSILLLRHAKSSWEDSSLTDFDRPLAQEGVDAATRLGIYLKDTLAPDFIIASPSVRTKSTLRLVQEHWASKVPVVYDDQLYSLTLSTYFNFVRRLNSNCSRIMLVGHNPAIHDLAHQLISNQEMVKQFPAAALLEIQWTGDETWVSLGEKTGTGVMFAPPKSTL